MKKVFAAAIWIVLALLSSGWMPHGQADAPDTKRSSVNVNFMDFIYDYALIDHIKIGNSMGPVATFWYTSGNQIWNRSILDANGWPNNSVANGNSYGSHILIPDSSVASSYVITFQGTGRVTFSPGTWTVTNSGTCSCTVNGNGDWTGTNARIEVTYTGGMSPAAGTAWRVIATSDTGSGFFRNLRFFRASDESRLNAGKVFRTGYLQTLVDLNPGVLRFMNWTGHNASQQNRFENRNTPNAATWGGMNPRISPAYPETSGTNNMTVCAGGVGCPAEMPVAMTHGEIMQTRVGTGIVRAGAKTISNITRANPGVVTATAHGFNTGDKVTYMITGGMPEIDHRQVTATVLDADNFSIGIDTTAFGPWSVATTGNTSAGSINVTGIPSTTGLTVGMTVTSPNIPAGRTIASIVSSTAITLSSGSSVTAGTGVSLTFTGAGTTMEYISLDVGGRGEYPVTFLDGTTPASNFSNNYLRAGDYRVFIFDKNQAASRDGSGNLVYGVWMIEGFASVNNLFYSPAQPLEVATGLVNEVNELALSQGITTTTSMWITVPHMGLSSIDPDYSAQSNWVQNAIDVVLNGANGYAGLVRRANLLVEKSNEWWNCCNFTFAQAPYALRYGFLRAGAAGQSQSYVSALLSTIMVRDARAANAPSRVKFVLAGQGTRGWAGSPNFDKAMGTAVYFADPAISPSVATPISHHDYFAWAGYFLAGSAYDSANLATLTAAYISHAGDSVAQEADMATYVNDGVVNSGFSESLGTYKNTRLPEYNDAMAALGKKSINYEAGWDKAVTSSASLVNATLNSTTSVTGMGSTTLTTGHWVVGDCIPHMTTVASAGSGTATLSNAATCTGTSTLTTYSDQNFFLYNVKRSQAWKDAYISYFNAFNSQSVSYLPADYIQVDQRWGHAYPDMYLGGVEGGRLDALWIAEGARNRALSP